MNFRDITLRTLIFSMCILCSSAFSQENDSDDLLLMIPAIAASLTPPDIGLVKVKELGGTFKFTRQSTISDDSFTEFFRFVKSSASATQDSNVFTIQGQSALSDSFSQEWCDGKLVGSYSKQEKLYLIVCDWGFPETDIGSVYAFENVKNSFPYEHFYYTPSDGQLIASGSAGTATKLSSAKQSGGLTVAIDTQARVKTTEKLLIEDYKKTPLAKPKPDSKISPKSRYQDQLNAVLHK